MPDDTAPACHRWPQTSHRKSYSLVLSRQGDYAGEAFLLINLCASDSSRTQFVVVGRVVQWRVLADGLSGVIEDTGDKTFPVLDQGERVASGVCSVRSVPIARFLSLARNSRAVCAESGIFSPLPARLDTLRTILECTSTRTLWRFPSRCQVPSPNSWSS